ncbi:MAG: glycosyltransferase family 2 protein [Chryseobacterium sp.]|nr:MAG: glycosyltransferase family 2 protein [Chryseobacterium sp.]
MKKVATIIVTYNGEKWIERCLDSVMSSSYPTDVFVVDNSSTDNTLSLLKSYNVFDLEVSETNLGFGAANNIALDKALKLDYDYFFLINQDVYIESNMIEKLIAFSDSHPESGIIAPIQYDSTGQKIDTNFIQYISLSIEKESYYDTSFVNAAAWLVTKKCLKTTGFFNSLMFPHYGEDRDFCNRVKFHNFSILITKGINVIHDRNQKMSLEKSIKLSKIKLLTIFLDPNYTKYQSNKIALINVLGMAKFFLKKYRSLFAIIYFAREYVRLFKQRNLLELEKKNQKNFNLRSNKTW